MIALNWHPVGETGRPNGRYTHVQDFANLLILSAFIRFLFLAIHIRFMMKQSGKSEVASFYVNAFVYLIHL